MCQHGVRLICSPLAPGASSRLAAGGIFQRTHALWIVPGDRRQLRGNGIARGNGRARADDGRCRGFRSTGATIYQYCITKPGRDGKILSDHRQDGNDEVHRL